jgi:predicted nucleic acid-binding protein
MELRFGALRAGWGELRRRRLERRIAEIAVVQPDDEMITTCAELRIRCRVVADRIATSVRGCRRRSS